MLLELLPISQDFTYFSQMKITFLVNIGINMLINLKENI